MTTATIRQIQHNLASVLQNVEAGEEVIICRRNRPIARIVPMNPSEERKADWSSLKKWRERLFPHGKLPGKAVSVLILEGRETDDVIHTYDTSALIQLYIVEDFTDEITSYTTTQGKPIAIHDLHVLEVENGLRAKVYRKEMSGNSMSRSSWPHRQGYS